jgi:hypothetical protein
LRIKSPNSPDVYLIDPDGYRRWIRTAAEYEQLFRDWNGIVINPNVRCILARDPLTDGHGNGAWLVRAQGDPAVYLIVDGTKRWIPSSAVFDKYHFAWNKVGVATRYQVDSTPTGAPWT